MYLRSVLIADLNVLLNSTPPTPPGKNRDKLAISNRIKLSIKYSNYVKFKNKINGYSMDNNKSAKIVNGNILTVENLCLIQYNKGSSFLENKLPQIDDFFKDSQTFYINA